MQQALSMSTELGASQSSAQPLAALAFTSAPATAAPEQLTAAGGAPLHDRSFMNGLLASLPGVDPSDPRIQLVLQQSQAKQGEDKSKDAKK